MPSQHGRTDDDGFDVGIAHAIHPVDLAHYLRQASITLRRHSTRLNEAWSKNRRPLTGPSTWKH